ncbi:ribose-phosphate pyrophosphokinase [Rickettsiales bacterium LUAb2]
MIILSGTSNLPLAEKIAKNLNTELGLIDIVRFSDQEIYAEIKQTVRGEDVYVVQSTSTPANDYLMELLIIIDALKRGSAKRINCVMPYFGYARQDRKTASRSPVSAKLVANLITVAGAHRVIALDLHSLQIQGFFDISVDHMLANVIFAKHIEQNIKDLNNTIIVSPDFGGVTRARQMAKHLNCDIAIIDKRRPTAGVSEVMNIIGNVEGKDCILIDDIADSTGTLCNAAQALKDKGSAKSVTAYCSHGIFSGSALEKLNKSVIEKLVCTDSIYNPKINSSVSNKIEYVTCSNLLADAIRQIANEQSTNGLFL